MVISNMPYVFIKHIQSKVSFQKVLRILNKTGYCLYEVADEESKMLIDDAP